MNLQICFVNDSGSDKDSDADDSKTETSLDTPLSPMSKQSSSYSDRDTTEEESESLDDMDFLTRQKKLQAEAKMAPCHGQTNGQNASRSRETEQEKVSRR